MKSHLVLRLGEENGVINHYKAAPKSPGTPSALETIPMELTPIGPHVKKLILRILLPESQSDSGEDGIDNQRLGGWNLWGKQLERITEVMDEVGRISDATAKVVSMLARVESVFVVKHAKLASDGTMNLAMNQRELSGPSARLL